MLVAVTVLRFFEIKTRLIPEVYLQTNDNNEHDNLIRTVVSCDESPAHYVHREIASSHSRDIMTIRRGIVNEIEDPSRPTKLNNVHVKW